MAILPSIVEGTSSKRVIERRGFYHVEIFVLKTLRMGGCNAPSAKSRSGVADSVEVKAGAV
jgi:hypothetical protein